MSLSQYIRFSSWVFLIIAGFHMTRLLLGWHVVLGGVTIPIYWSFFGLLFAGTFAYVGLRLSGEKHE